MTFPTLPDPVPDQIDSNDAYALIAEHGVDRTVARPACEILHLKNGAKVTLWYGGGYDDISPYWTLDAKEPAEAGSRTQT